MRNHFPSQNWISIETATDETARIFFFSLISKFTLLFTFFFSISWQQRKWGIFFLFSFFLRFRNRRQIYIMLNSERFNKKRRRGRRKFSDVVFWWFFFLEFFQRLASSRARMYWNNFRTTSCNPSNVNVAVHCSFSTTYYYY